METPFPHLLSPIRIGGVTFRNRLFAAPTGLQACQDGGIAPTEEAIAHFESRAKAGAACVTCVGASIFPVDPSQRKAFWDIYDPMARNRMAYLARRIHLHGAKASMELGVAGVVARNMVVSEGAPTLWAVPGKEMTREDIQETVRGYADAAAAMVECGFDMVLLHFGHGLQVGQFSPRFITAARTNTVEALKTAAASRSRSSMPSARASAAGCSSRFASAARSMSRAASRSRRRSPSRGSLRARRTSFSSPPVSTDRAG